MKLPNVWKLLSNLPDLYQRVKKLEKQQMLTQTDIDAITARVTALETATDTLIQQLKDLINAPGDISTADLEAAVKKFEDDIAGQSVP